MLSTATESVVSLTKTHKRIGGLHNTATEGVVLLTETHKKVYNSFATLQVSFVLCLLAYVITTTVVDSLIEKDLHFGIHGTPSQW